MIDRSIESIGTILKEMETLQFLAENCDEQLLRTQYELELSESIQAFSEYQKELKGKLADYFSWCKDNQIPVYINYYRVYREL